MAPVNKEPSFTRVQVVRAARALINTPYHHQGRKAGVGVDCVGLLACVADKLKIPYTWIDNYPAQADGNLMTLLGQYGVLQGIINPQAGDIGIFFFVYRNGAPLAQHAGIFGTSPTGGRTLIHCYMDIGKVVEHSYDHAWDRRLMAVLRLRGLVD